MGALPHGTKTLPLAMAALEARSVILHVYDLPDCESTNRWLFSVGLGVYHTGLEVGGMEFSFSDQGIVKCAPMRCPAPPREDGEPRFLNLRQSIELGVFHGSANEVSQVVRSLREDFAPGTYHVVSKNCNAFSNAFSERLIGVSIPRWVNRLAATAGRFGIGAGGEAVGGAGEDGGAAAPPKKDDPRHKKKELTEQQKKLLAKLKS